MSVIGRRAEGVARHSRRRPARDAGIETASKRHQNENGRRGELNPRSWTVQEC
ncbi:chorismate synthase [Burkholderia pseudomallei]|uniref:Chorismate synthase n=1 Tax=Burkholderia pseudomallei TaxID=28450 RepID=A0AAX0UBJ6_BURPE|nr:chorismate synthase [Burkholderia pseudomallei]PJO66176.1 chorismate synthase [Burkholderia pseudomallei]PPF08781.1 chorismate synthase [Burkholderia pseudomallei]